MTADYPNDHNDYPNMYELQAHCDRIYKRADRTDAAEAHAKALEHDLDRARRLIGLLRAEKAILRTALEAEKSDRMEWAKSCVSRALAHRRLSTLVRRNVTATDYHAWTVTR